jgi:hypothetical protein
LTLFFLFHHTIPAGSSPLNLPGQLFAPHLRGTAATLVNEPARQATKAAH